MSGMKKTKKNSEQQKTEQDWFRLVVIPTGLALISPNNFESYLVSSMGKKLTSATKC